MSMLLCDFHIHTTWSDGSVDLPEVVDIYGQAGFDVISITDHVYNSDSTIGSWADRAVAVVDMVGDGDDVESRLAVYVDHFRKIDRSVRPGGMDVEVAQQHGHDEKYSEVGLRG